MAAFVWGRTTDSELKSFSWERGREGGLKYPRSQIPNSCINRNINTRFRDSKLNGIKKIQRSTHLPIPLYRFGERVPRASGPKGRKERGQPTVPQHQRT